MEQQKVELILKEELNFTKVLQCAKDAIITDLAKRLVP